MRLFRWHASKYIYNALKIYFETQLVITTKVESLDTVCINCHLNFLLLLYRGISFSLQYLAWNHFNRFFLNSYEEIIRD